MNTIVPSVVWLLCTLALSAQGADPPGPATNMLFAAPQVWLRSLTNQWTTGSNSTPAVPGLPLEPQVSTNSPAVSRSSPTTNSLASPLPVPPGSLASNNVPPVPAPAAARSAAMMSAPSVSEGAASATVLRDPQALAALMASLDDTKKLGAGDKVTYRVLEDQDETKPLTVSDSGALDVPYFGLVQADKKGCRQLALEVKDLLEKRNYRRATVIISLQEINRKRTLGKVYVVGQVRQSGPLEIPDDEVFTVSKAILRAGGFSDFADKHKVKLIRGTPHGQESKNTTVVNVADIWDKGKTSNDVAVQADDVVFVPKRNINF